MPLLGPDELFMGNGNAVEDPDGHVLRFGTDPNYDKPFLEEPVNSKALLDLLKHAAEWADQ